MAKTVISERFYSVFRASLASMSISYVLILTDNVVAGQFVGENAVAAMTLVAPIMTLVFFLSYMISDGLAMMFSYAKGNNDRQKANELFGMGTICTAALSVTMTVAMFVFDEKILGFWDISPELMSYALDYYHGLILATAPTMLNIFFYTIYIAEGEENICVKASAAMFVVNMILDVLLGYKIGVIGIGIATAGGALVSFLWHVPYLFSPECQLRLLKYWNGKEFWRGIFYSWYHSMDTLYLTLLPMIFSLFVIKTFSENYLIVVTVIFNMLTLLIAFYTGLVDCLQPMICQYHAENALHSVKKTMRYGINSTIALTVVLILFAFVFAEFLPGMFGVSREEQLYSDCVVAVRIFMPFTIFLGVTLMFSNYYIYIERLNFGAAIKTLLLLILPAAGMFAGVFGLPFMWLGVGASFIVALLINFLVTRRNLLLIDGENLSRQFSFDADAKLENLPALKSSLEKFFAQTKLEPRNFLTALTEEIFAAYAARAENFLLEVSIIPAERTVLIFRENGKPDEPRSRMLDNVSEKNYMISGDENKFVVTV